MKISNTNTNAFQFVLGIFLLTRSINPATAASPRRRTTSNGSGSSKKSHAAVIKVDDTGMGDFITIQQAIDAAEDGDTIIINEHSSRMGWQENVFIDKAHLTLVGSGKSNPIIKDAAKISGNSNDKSKNIDDNEMKDLLSSKKFLTEQKCPIVYLDGCDESNACGNAIITVDAPGVTIENFFIRHGHIVFTEASHNGTVANSCLLGDTDYVIRPNAPNFEFYASPDEGATGITIEGNFFQGGSRAGVLLLGDNHVVRHNVMALADDGIEIRGNDGSIIGNSFTGCNERCIGYNGNDGIITYNTILYGHAGIFYRGVNPTISHNFIKAVASECIHVHCDGRTGVCSGGTISHNQIIGAVDTKDGLKLSISNNFQVAFNEIYYATDKAIRFSGDNSTIRGNLAVRCGTRRNRNRPTIGITGGNNTIDGNEIYYSTETGILQASGDGNIYHGNTIIGSGRAGIEVRDGSLVTIEKNEIEDGHGEGIAIIGGTDHVVIENELTNNRVDICWDDLVPTGDDDVVFEDNSFETGGISTPCVAVSM